VTNIFSAWWHGDCPVVIAVRERDKIEKH